MNEKVKQAFKLLCEQYVKDLNRYENKEIAKDYFYNPKYECGFKTDGKNVYFADILKAFDNMEELIKGKDEYIAKLCNDRAELKEQLKQVEDFKYHYDRYKKELANSLKVINCMQEEETTNRNLIESLEDRNDRFVERLEKQKAELKDLQEFARYFTTCSIVHDNDMWVGKRYFEREVCGDKKFDLVKKVVDKYGK